MKNMMDLEIITANRTVVRTTVQEVYVPAALGQAGVLHHHLPYTALLEMGEVSYQEADGTRHSLFLRGGLIETVDNKIVIMAEQVIKADELDASELRVEMTALRETIKGAAKGTTSPEELGLALARERELAVLLGMVEEKKKRN